MNQWHTLLKVEKILPSVAKQKFVGDFRARKVNNKSLNLE